MPYTYIRTYLYTVFIGTYVCMCTVCMYSQYVSSVYCSWSTTISYMYVCMYIRKYATYLCVRVYVCGTCMYVHTWTHTHNISINTVYVPTSSTAYTYYVHMYVCKYMILLSSLQSCTVCPVYNYDRVCQCRCSCVQDDEQDSCTMNTDKYVLYMYTRVLCYIYAYVFILFISVCLCYTVHMYMHVSVHVIVHVCVCLCEGAYGCMHANMCLYVHLHKCMYVCMYTCA